MKRFVEIDTPLEPGTFLFHKMHAHEELSRLSDYEVHLLSLDPAVKLGDVLGKSVTVKLELANDKVREFSGYVTQLGQVGMHGRYYAYRATVRPWLWFLTRTTNCRVFQEKSVPDILKEVFAQHSAVADVKFELTESYSAWDYCVQYRETDFNFVSRLMEHEGMYYFFKHSEGRHTLVVADSYSAHAVANGGEIPFIDPEKLVRRERNHVSEWSHVQELQPGKYALTDYDFEKPSVDLQVKSNIKRDHAMAEYEWYDYPGDYLERGDGESYVRTRLEEVQSKFERVQGTTNARALATGYLFTLTSHWREDQNTEYLVVSAEYDLKSNEYESSDATGADYHCRFSALNSHQSFRPERITPKPIVQGPQTAITVGPAGEAIYTDKYGRVKVQFHWDRYGKKDDKSSCWIRVSQNWGGKGWGGMFIPHTGQEVIVQFLEGDPDMPLITGRVYNAENMPPVELPAGKTKSVIRDHGANEIIMEGDAGKQRITMSSPHAKTSFSMGAPNSPKPGFSFTTQEEWNEFVKGRKEVHIDGVVEEYYDRDYLQVIKGNQLILEKGNYTMQVDGRQEYSTKGDYVTHVNGGCWTTILKKNFMTVVGADIDSYLSYQHCTNVGVRTGFMLAANVQIITGASLTIDKAKDLKKTPLYQSIVSKEYRKAAKMCASAAEGLAEIKDFEAKSDKYSVKAKNEMQILVGKLKQEAEDIVTKVNSMKIDGDKLSVDAVTAIKKKFKTLNFKDDG